MSESKTSSTPKESNNVMHDKSGVTKYSLDNGLTVILQENHSSPVVAVNVWVKVGSACEEEGEYGLAHVHEHMLFKGTEKRSVGEIARVIESSGGDINAFTSFDETVYYVVIASRYLDTALDVLADAMQNSAFDPEELEKELEVVLEEIRRGQDSPSRNISEKMFSTLFTEHPYGRPVIGSTESVKSFTREKILNFYNKWYKPNNMVLVLVGDFNTQEVKPKINEAFGALKEGELPACDIKAEPPQTETRPFVIDKSLQEGYFSVAFHTPNAKHEDTPTLDIISGILGGGESSRLYRSIKEDKALVNNIYAYSFTPKHEGVFAVGGSIAPDKSTEALKEILAEINRLKNEPVSREELRRAKINIESDAVYTKETMQGQAQKLGFYEVEADDYRYEEDYLRAISDVTTEDIQRVANKYFNTPNMSTGFLHPSESVSISETEILDIAKASSNEGSTAKAKVKSDDQKEEVSKFVLDNGITLLVKENHSVPLFAARAAFLGGIRFEQEKNNGVSNYVSRMLTRGTKSRSTEEIAKEIESLAGSINGFSGRNSFGVTVEALSRNFDNAMELFADVLLHPSFNDQEIERARREILAEINRQGDNLLKTAVNLFLSTLYSEHPYKFPVLGTKETVDGIKQGDLVEFYQNYARPENMVITVVGDVDTDQVLLDVKEKFGSMTKGSSVVPEIKPEPPVAEVREKTEHKAEKSQTHIIMGFQGPGIKDPDHYSFEVLNTILSGQGGRLFLELRDKKSLAYTVTSFYTPGLEPGFFGVYIGTAPQKETEAVGGIKEQLELLLSDGVTEQEIDRAKNYLVGNFEIGLQQNSSQAAKIAFDELYEIGWEEYHRYPERINSVNAEDVLNAAKKYIDLDKYTLVVVKPEDPA